MTIAQFPVAPDKCLPLNVIDRLRQNTGIQVVDEFLPLDESLL
jgi:hypothetical protein